MQESGKETNPKDAVAGDKLGLHLVPPAVPMYAAMAFMEGAVKYGSYNFRVMGVSASVYKSALERHLMKWWNGEWCDPKTTVPHLASVIACAGIILDAIEQGRLNDDRPPAQPNFSDSLDERAADVVKHLKELFKDKSPVHWTQQLVENQNSG